MIIAVVRVVVVKRVIEANLSTQAYEGLRVERLPSLIPRSPQ
jgi:hypothetical protein